MLFRYTIRERLNSCDSRMFEIDKFVIIISSTCSCPFLAFLPPNNGLTYLELFCEFFRAIHQLNQLSKQYTMIYIAIVLSKQV